MGDDKNKGYAIILPLWARLGKLDKIEKAAEADVRSGIIQQAKIAALVAK